MKGLRDRPGRQAVLFLVLLFGVTWGLIPLLPAPEGNWALQAQFIATVWAPTILALALVLLVGGAEGFARELRMRLTCSLGGAWWVLFAAVVPIIVTLAAVFAARAAGDGAPFVSSSAILTVVGLQIATGAVGEELGWRGYLLPRLGACVGETAAGWMMGCSGLFGTCRRF